MKGDAIILLMILVFYITYWTTMAYSVIGDTTDIKTVEWYFPIQLFCFMIVPAAIAFFIGLSMGENR